MNYKIRVTKEESIKVQEHCFNNMIYWNGMLAGRVDNEDKPFLHIYIHRGTFKGILLYGNVEELFKSHENTEVTPEQFLAMSYDDMVNGNIPTKREESVTKGFKTKWDTVGFNR